MIYHHHLEGTLGDFTLTVQTTENEQAGEVIPGEKLTASEML